MLAVLFQATPAHAQPPAHARSSACRLGVQRIARTGVRVGVGISSGYGRRSNCRDERASFVRAGASSPWCAAIVGGVQNGGGRSVLLQCAFQAISVGQTARLGRSCPGTIAFAASAAVAVTGGAENGEGEGDGSAGACALAGARTVAAALAAAGGAAASAAGGRGLPAFASIGRSRFSVPLKISLQAPQRTRPPRSLSWSWTTRKVVRQCGQRVASTMAATGRRLPGAPGLPAPPSLRVRPRRRAPGGAHRRQ